MTPRSSTTTSGRSDPVTAGSAAWPGPDGSRSATTRTRRRRTATFPTDEHGVRWSVPGDLASVGPDGVITVHGRGSASINSGGEKIFPEEVEAAVKEPPGVYDAIVVGLPDERFGERVAAVVRMRDGAEPLTIEALRDHCRSRIAGYKVPRQLLLVDEIPLTAAGKPDARAARALFTPD